MTDVKAEALEALNQRAREVALADSKRANAIIDALLAGASQREVARWSRLSVNTVRALIKDAGIAYGGIQYHAEGIERVPVKQVAPDA